MDEEDLSGEYGKVEWFPLLEPGLAVAEGKERLKQVLLLHLGFEHLLAGDSQRFKRKVGIGEGDLEQRAAQGERRA
jgi:hypothetical protein